MIWNKKVTQEEFDEVIDSIYDVRHALTKRLNNQETKLDLILSHLKLKYVPETETKEPAKLVEQTVNLGADWGQFITASAPSWVAPSMPCGPTPTKPKKKGRPKKK